MKQKDPSSMNTDKSVVVVAATAYQKKRVISKIRQI